MIHTSLSPNTERDDVLLALKVLVSPWTWGDARFRAEFEEKFAHLFPESFHVATVDSGRTALFSILKSLGVGAGDEVLVQAYTCVAVPGPVLWAGATPVFVDCEDDFTMSLSDLLKKVTPKTKVIVVQHTFGQPARIKEIISFARARNLFVIEDCAHSIGAMQDGMMLGTFGDAAFFSFGRDKCISSVFGGAIITQSPELFGKILAQIGGYKRPSLLWVKRQLLHPIVLAVAKATYTIPFRRYSIGKILLEAAKRFHIISKAVESGELSGGRPSFAFRTFSPALARLALHQLSKLDRFNTHRQTIARTYAEALSHALVPGHSYLRYTCTADSAEQRKKYVSKAHAHGIQLGDWYTTPVAPARVDLSAVGYVRGSCPNAERLASLSFNLPTHIGVSEADAKTVISHVFN